MALFGKEACTFCNTEVGMLKRSKLATKEYICNDCKRKTNFFARMDYTSKEDAQRMMDSLQLEAEDFEASYEGAQNRFESAERHWTYWHIGSRRVGYRCNTRLGAFQLTTNDMHSDYIPPVFYFSQMVPYSFGSNDGIFADSRRMEIMNANAEYVTVSESKDSEGKVTEHTLIIPYNDPCIREIRIQASVSDRDEHSLKDVAERINNDRKSWISKGVHDTEQKNKMHLRNLSDTVTAAAKAAVTGGDVQEAVKEGMEMAEDIEKGKVKQSFFGKLFRK